MQSAQKTVSNYLINEKGCEGKISGGKNWYLGSEVGIPHF